MAGQLPNDDLTLIEHVLQRKPNALEVELFEAMWSEHCSYRHTKPLLKELPNVSTRVVAGVGEGAGAVRLSSGAIVVFKLESHNHPSYIDPYEGAATGVGGILRDVFSMGARPIVVAGALTLATAHGAHFKSDASEDEDSQGLGLSIVRGFQAYNEAFGVASGALSVQIDERFDRNPLVNVMAIGMIEGDTLILSRVSSPGFKLIYAGKAADHAGLGGAAFASAARSQDGEAEGGVPRAYPEIGKRLYQATQTLIQLGLIQAMQDMGAAGLLSASVEMAAKSGLGVELCLERVPRMYDTVDARVMLLSETQERMLYAVRPENVQKTLDVLASYGLEGALIGELIAEDRYVARWEETVLVDVPASFLSSGVPLVDLRRIDIKQVPHSDELTEDLMKGSAHRKREAETTRQQSMMVTDRQAYVTSVLEKTWSRIESCAFPHAWPHTEEAVVVQGAIPFAYAIEQATHLVERDPYRGTAKLVSRAAFKLALSGSTPLALTNNLNFGDPHDPRVRVEIVESVRGMGVAARALKTPVISGNVSLYNATEGRSIPPNPVIGMVGDREQEGHGHAPIAQDKLVALEIVLGEPQDYNRLLPLLEVLRDLVNRGVIVRGALWPEKEILEDPASIFLEILCYWLLDDTTSYTLDLERMREQNVVSKDDRTVDVVSQLGMLLMVRGAAQETFDRAIGEHTQKLPWTMRWYTVGAVGEAHDPFVTVSFGEVERKIGREEVRTVLERGQRRW